MYLHATGADDVECWSHACNELDDFVEAVISDTPGAVNEEDHVCLGTFTNCCTDSSVKGPSGWLDLVILFYFEFYFIRALLTI